VISTTLIPSNGPFFISNPPFFESFKVAQPPSAVINQAVKQKRPWRKPMALTI
jgi:hypothetical protein